MRTPVQQRALRRHLPAPRGRPCGHLRKRSISLSRPESSSHTCRGDSRCTSTNALSGPLSGWRSVYSLNTLNIEANFMFAWSLIFSKEGPRVASVEPHPARGPGSFP